jgi:hypothetical protein
MQGVGDLAAMDIQRGRDHGIATYNQLREAYGLPRKSTFAAITGEPDGADTALDLNDPTILDFVELRDARGAVLPPGTQTGAAFGLRRTSLAARLHAIYGTVDDVDAFVGMVSEAHVPGTEMGELQLAMWKRQFTALRDGDRFFYARDPMLRWIRKRFGITYRHTLAQLIALNTDEPLRNLPANVFFAG